MNQKPWEEMSLDERVNRMATSLTPRIVELLRSVVLAHPSSKIDDVFALVGLVEDHTMNAVLDEEDQIWRQVVAHFAGMAPALHLARAHVEGFVPNCSGLYLAGEHRTRCRVAPDEWESSIDISAKEAIEE